MKPAPFACLAFFTGLLVQPSLAETAIADLSALARLDQLPRLRESARVGGVTSYDRTGENDDGFSGKYSVVRKEGDGLVIADLVGPGVITRIATPTPSDSPIEFYFDGEATPRIRLPFRQLFDGSTTPFLTPLVDQGHGGNWCYVPIPYAKSCKVVIRGPEVQFYQINTVTYPAGTAVHSFERPATSAAPDLEPARHLLSRAGEDVSAMSAAPGAVLHTERRTVQLAPGATAELFRHDHGGRIVGFRLGPTKALAGQDRALVLRMTWDDAATPDVLVPAGDFFGFSWGEPAMRSLLVGSTADQAYCYFPMPFARSARIELQSERTAGAPVELTAEMVYADEPRDANEGRFTAVWRRENPTTPGKPFTYVDLAGRGHLVGVALQAEGEKNGATRFFEGDDEAVIDGALALHGTGSEDFFNGGWYDVPGKWERRISYPLNGCLDYLRPVGRSGGYRLLLNDAYVFQDHLQLTMEHGENRAGEPADYAAVSYLYLAAPATPAPSLPPAAARVVTAVNRLIYKPGWYYPPITFSIEGSTVTHLQEKIEGEEHRSLSLRTSAPEIMTEHHLAFFCDVPNGGRYRVLAQLMQGPDLGGLQLFANGKPAGPVATSQAQHRAVGPVVPLGEMELTEGYNRLFLVLSPPAAGVIRYGVDLESLILERLP